MKFNVQGVPDQIQSHKSSVASGVSAQKSSQNYFQNMEMFGQMFRTLMSAEVIGRGAGEISEIFGTLRSAPRTDREKLNIQPASETSRVKGVKEEYNQDEHQNFKWMMEEARKLKEILERFEDILAGQGGL